MIPFAWGIRQEEASLCCSHKQSSNLMSHTDIDWFLAGALYSLIHWGMARGWVPICAILVLSPDPRLAAQPPSGTLLVTLAEEGVLWRVLHGSVKSPGLEVIHITPVLDSIARVCFSIPPKPEVPPCCVPEVRVGNIWWAALRDTIVWWPFNHPYINGHCVGHVSRLCFDASLNLHTWQYWIKPGWLFSGGWDLKWSRRRNLAAH